jgi:ferredoxin
MKRKPYVDQDACISCGLCVTTAPEVFRMDDNNLATVYDPEGAPEDIIQQAIDGCPVDCIHWE